MIFALMDGIIFHAMNRNLALNKNGKLVAVIYRS